MLIVRTTMFRLHIVPSLLHGCQEMECEKNKGILIEGPLTIYPLDCDRDGQKKKFKETSRVERCRWQGAGRFEGVKNEFDNDGVTRGWILLSNWEPQFSLFLFPDINSLHHLPPHLIINIRIISTDLPITCEISLYFPELRLSMIKNLDLRSTNKFRIPLLFPHFSVTERGIAWDSNRILNCQREIAA